jgi:MFS family permease
MRAVFALAAVPGIIALAVLALGVREGARGTVAADAGTGAPESASSSGGAPSVGPPPRLHHRSTEPPAGHQSVADDITSSRATFASGERLGGRFWAYLATVLLFTLGNSTDAFLLLRAAELGVPAALTPVLWAMLHVVKSAASTPGGALSDRVGRRPLIVGGWLLYAAVYLAFGRASEPWHAWALFAIYGVYFGFTEGVEKALVADIVPAARRGAAYGWYNLAIGIGALPASVLFGAIWDQFGAPAAFGFGAAMAAAAAVGIALVAPARSVPRGSPGA